jgi:MFS transporter, SP family, arabinose:H+ symporter
MENAISLGGVMMCFAGLALGAVAFVYWFLPETKGHSVEEIIQLFEREAKAPTTPAATPDRPGLPGQGGVEAAHGKTMRW